MLPPRRHPSAPIWCSSAVTTTPVSLAARITASVSIGFMVCMLMTRVSYPKSFFSIQAARIASGTIGPQATIVRSSFSFLYSLARTVSNASAKLACSPRSRMTFALPKTNGVFSFVTIGVASRAKRMYFGPACSNRQVSRRLLRFHRVAGNHDGHIGQCRTWRTGLPAPGALRHRDQR